MSPHANGQLYIKEWMNYQGKSDAEVAAAMRVRQPTVNRYKN
jgi:predicted XRE-type DNA-binding protein